MIQIKPKEIILVDKVVDMINNVFPQELKRAVKVYQKEPEAKNCKRDIDFSRGFLSWFLLKRTVQGGITPMELAYSFPLDYFTAEERKIIKNFLNFRESVFEIINISDNKKDYLLQDVLTNKEFLIKTIDFDSVLSGGDFVIATVVSKIEGDYFFYGNVGAYSREVGLKVKKSLIEANKRVRRPIAKRNVEVEWEIRR